MTLQDSLHCTDERRRILVRQSELNGIDHLEVIDTDYERLSALPAGPGETPEGLRQRTLLVRFLKPIDGLTGANVRITGGERVTGIGVEWAQRATADLRIQQPNEVLVVRTTKRGDFSTYTLRIVDPDPPDPERAGEPPAGFDRVLSAVDFSFKVDCPSDLDCRAPEPPPSPPGPGPRIDYLAKDYASFRRLMLDRLSVLMPSWRGRSEAGLMATLVELLAHAGDHLSYFQDAAATEAYLGTARRRTSVRRHARLLDYRMHEGANARAIVVLEVEKGGGADGLPLREGTAVVTKAAPGAPSSSGPVVAPELLDQVVRERAEVFETRHPLSLRWQHNRIPFYTWQNDTCYLPKGATRATLRGDSEGRVLELVRGDLLVFSTEHPALGGSADHGPMSGTFGGRRYHVVRLTEIGEPNTDEIPGTGVSETAVSIGWDAEDALPFPMCLRRDGTDVAFVYGNVVLVDHGRTVRDPELQSGDSWPDEWTVPWDLDDGEASGVFRPVLTRTNLAYGAYGREFTVRTPAAELTRVDPRELLPWIGIEDRHREEEDGHVTVESTWTPRHDLLDSRRFDRHFAVDLDENRVARIRFGDGILGKEPGSGSRMQATYRVGGGSAGNVGAGTLTRIVGSFDGIRAVLNPLPAFGGLDPESMEEVRLYAPQAFRTQNRAVTPEDYALRAERHSEVQRAAATRRWTGSWYTMFVTADRRGGGAVDFEFEQRLLRHIEPYRLAGHDLEVDAPQFVPVRISLCVCVQPDVFAADVEHELLAAFGTGTLADGRRGFFHPDNFTFGQPLFYSDVVGAAMAVSGVRWVEPIEFRRLLDLPQELETSCASEESGARRLGTPDPEAPVVAGVLEVGRLEIVRCDSDPNAPGNGSITFSIGGGL